MPRTRTKKHAALYNSRCGTFINSAIPAALSSEMTTGVPASITIAQAALESGWGEHHMGAANNYFGIKAQTVKGKIVFGSEASGYVDQTTTEYLHGKKVTITAHFRSYKSMTKSFVDHGLFLRSNPRYRTALVAYKKTGNADEFAHGLQNAGYATDPNYAHLLISIMKKHNLYKYNLQRCGA